MTQDQKTDQFYNRQLRNLKRADQTKIVKQLKGEGWTLQQIADYFGVKSLTWVRNRLRG